MRGKVGTEQCIKGRTAEVLKRSSRDIFLKLFFDFRLFFSWSSSFGVFLDMPS